MIFKSSRKFRTPIQAPESDAKNLQLRLRSSLPDSYYTGNKAEGKFDSAIRVELIDKSTGHVVTLGPLSCVKLEVVAVDGNFDNEDGDDWTLEDFKRHVVTDRDGKKLLTGNLELALKKGEGFLAEFTFTDNSSWIRSKKIRLGVQVASGFCEGIRVREAKSNAFFVKDRRGEGCRKHDLPAPDDEVWRLRNIGKDGAFHKRLNEARIFKVRDFLWKLKLSRKELREVLGTTMSNGKWETLEKHAETCDLSGKYYVYYDENNKSTGVIFEKIFELCGFTEGGVCYSAENIPVPKKDYADTLIGKACDNACGRWEHIVEYHRPMPSDMKPSKRARVSATHVVPGAPARSCHTDLRVRRQDPPVPIVQQVPAPGRSPSDGHVREDPTFYSMEDPGGGTSDLFAWARDFLTDGEPAPDPELADGTSELSVEGERDRLPPIDRTWEDILACAEANSGSDQLNSTVFGTPVASRDRALVNQMFDEHYGHFEDRYCMVGADIQGELRPRAPSNRSYIEGDIISESWLL